MFEVHTPFFPVLTTASSAVAVLLFNCFDTAAIVTHLGPFEVVFAEKVEGEAQ